MRNQVNRHYPWRIRMVSSKTCLLRGTTMQACLKLNP